MPESTTISCPTCNGHKTVVRSADPKGRLIHESCPTCGGAGVVAEDRVTPHDREDGFRKRRKRTAAQKKALATTMLMADPDGNVMDPTIKADATVVTPGTARATIKAGSD